MLGFLVASALFSFFLPAPMVAEVAQASADVKISEARNALRVRQAELDQLSETAEKVAHANAMRAESEGCVDRNSGGLSRPSASFASAMFFHR